PPGMQELPTRSAPRRRPLRGSRDASPGTCRITCGPPEATGSPSPVSAEERTTRCIIRIRSVRPRTVRHNPNFQTDVVHVPAKIDDGQTAATEPQHKERPMAVSFATNIRPMFTDMDIAHMKNFGVLLDDFGFMRDPANAQKGPERGQQRDDAAQQQRRDVLVT